MEFGICLPHYGLAMEPDRIKDFSHAAEELDYHSLWVTDHIVVPKERDMLYKHRMLDPLATLTYLGGITSKIRIGTSVIVLPYRHPVLVAKAIATADLLSGGRVIFGAGVGALQGEFIALNANFPERGKVADEYLDFIKKIWVDPESDYPGEFVSFKDIYYSPLPAQLPHPPIWIGGSTKRSGRRAVEYGTAWHPTNVTPQQYSEIVEYMGVLAERRGDSHIPDLTIRMPVYFDEALPPGRMGWAGNNESIIQQVQEFVEVGVKHVVFGFPDLVMDEALEQLDRLAKEVIPQIR